MTTNCKACWDSTTGRCLKHRAHPVVLALAALVVLPACTLRVGDVETRCNPDGTCNSPHLACVRSHAQECYPWEWCCLPVAPDREGCR